MTNVGLLRLLLCKRCIMREELFFPFLHHRSLCPGMKSCLSSLSLLMRESSTTVRLRTSLIMSVGIGCFGHRLRSFSIHPLSHRDTAPYLEALASSAWTAYRYRIIGTATQIHYIYDTRTRIRANRGSMPTPLSSTKPSVAFCWLHAVGNTSHFFLV